MTAATAATRAIDADEPALTSTGERFIPGLGGAIELEHLHRYLFARAACADRDVLDIASGEGYGSAFLAQAARSVVGVDIADEAVRHARKHYGASNLRFETGSCAAIPMADASVDVVVSFETIEHHDQHVEMMNEIRRVLRPGGLLILSSPERFEYSERPGTHNAFHVRELYRHEFIDLVRGTFAHVDVYDQKVLFGSTILAEERATRATSVDAAVLHERARGLVRPLYLIAVASDAPLDPLDTGVFEQQLSETSEWKWWIDTVGERDGQIRRLHEQIGTLEAARANHLELAASLAEAERSLAEARDAVATRETALSGLRDEWTEATAQRDEALRAVEQARTDTAMLETRLDEAREALVAQKAALEADAAERDALRQRAWELRHAEQALARAESEHALREEASSREHDLRERFLARERALLEQAAARQAAWDSRNAIDQNAISHLRQRTADLSADLARRTHQHDEASARIAWLEEQLRHRNTELEARAAETAWLASMLAERQRETVAADAYRASLVHQHQELAQYVAKLEWLLSITGQARDETHARAATLERLLEQERGLHEAMRASTSWRITRPVRAVKRGLDAARRWPTRTFDAGLRSLRGTYRRIPGDGVWKPALKDGFFRMFGFALRDTGPYRDWLVHGARIATIATVISNDRSSAALFIPPEPEPAAPVATNSVPPFEVPAEAEARRDTELPPVEPIPQLAEETTVMTEAPSHGPTYSAAGLPLWAADGVAEWADLAVLRARIDAVAAAHRAAIVPAPVATVEIADDDVERVAERLVFAAPDAPVVTILIPAYNHIAMTLECLSSIAEAKCAVPFEVLVADDASTDRTPEILDRIPGLARHRNATNLHFLRNCNAALASAAGRYVVFLNNDVQVQDWWLDELVDAFDRHEHVGAVGPKIVYPSGLLQEAGCALNRDMTVDMVGHGDDPALPRYNYARRVDYCSGACLIVPTALLRELGGFDEAFAPAYCEDGDLCLRIREKGLFVYYEPKATVIHRLSATTAKHRLDDKRRMVAANLATFAERWQARVEDAADVRAIAFYLPQFYPFPENDRWWGKGFTEWTNVTKAQPNFVGHYQPHLPADLGYYDLRRGEAMEEQAKLARRYGLGGFCFYYYWFAGKRLLDVPLERMLATGKPDFPFCLCWANENWTRRWDGQETHVLMAQSHSDADDEAVILDLIRYFRSPNYIRIDGRPLLVIYRVTLFPDFARTAAHWRAVCRDQGIGEIHLSMVESFELVSSAFHPSRYGCDATIEFPPQGLAEQVPASGPLINPEFVGSCVDYRALALRYCNRPAPAYTRFRGAMPGWDNTPRRQNNSYCIEHASPGGFQAWLEHIVDDARCQHFGDERIVFINAWNEWAEGAHLEPDRRFGHTYLEALANARDRAGLLRARRYAFDG